MNYGYARVSTIDQNEDRQFIGKRYIISTYKRKISCD